MKRYKVDPKRINYEKSEVHVRYHDQGAFNNARYETHKYYDFFACDCKGDKHYRADCLLTRRGWYFDAKKKNPNTNRYKSNYTIYYWIKEDDRKRKN